MREADRNAPSEMRDDMAKVLSRHSDVVHHSASSLSDNVAIGSARIRPS
ncbi:hypothetical protein QCN29_00985 [Streptomyces sp. HNM0663]|uniref:Uncharacterized protein n=1 Tax=Streptomyces chengmaiensis TaxID=3040919 RepID=A0ABT6HFM8_9ACTN|nr:hypothetical protein [Streptomyces chengmaiensis]MDH2387381.1 hypothetical protein [Streptomyces chengmaiensis]